MITNPNRLKVSKFNWKKYKHLIIFLISGKAGTGKTTSAGYLEDFFQGHYGVVAVEHFGEAVKSVASYFGWSGRKDEKGRKLLQDVGQLGWNYNESLWVKYLVGTVLDKSVFPNVLIIDDWRFPHEYKHLLEAFDALTIPTRVCTLRLDAWNREELRGTSNYNNISEVALDDFASTFDQVVDNRGTKEELKECLFRISEEILKEIIK